MGELIGDRIRELRKERGWTLRQLAERVEFEDDEGQIRRGIDFTFLSKIENDKEKASAKTIRALAKALGADPEELLLLGQKIPAATRTAMTSSPSGRTFLRTARNLSESDWKELVEKVKQMRKKK
jgi:HTH-type transcriptional regulator, competence development regulator